MAGRRINREPGELQPVGGMIQQILRRLGLDQKLAEYRAVEAWAEVVGPAVAAQASATSIRDGVLFVDVTSNVWMQELGLLRESIIERMNARLGAPLVRKVVLSIERGPQHGGAAAWEREGEAPHGD